MSAAPDRLEAGYAACVADAGRAAGNFALGMRLLPARERRALAVVYWFADRADQAVDARGPAAERFERLERIRGRLAGALTGDPTDARWAALADVARGFDIPGDLLAAIVDGVARDLEPVAYPDWEALREYCWGVAGAVGLVSLRIFGGSGPAAERAAEETGYALQLTNILRDLREDAVRGRWYLPADESARFGVRREDVALGRPTPGFEALVAFQVERARRLYGAVPDLCRRLPRATRACPAALAGVYRGLLERIARDPRAALDGPVRLSTAAKALRGIGAAVAAHALAAPTA